MKVYLLGKRQVKYTDKKTGEVKEYAELHYSYDARSTPSVNIDGKVADKVYIGYDEYDDIPVDCEANLNFDNHGYFVGIDIL